MRRVKYKMEEGMGMEWGFPRVIIRGIRRLHSLPLLSTVDQAAGEKIILTSEEPCWLLL